MQFDPPLIPATLLARYKRFLADVRMANGEVMTVHCPNTGAMTNCIVPESPCWLSVSANPKRKYRHTLEIATALGGCHACVNTVRANALVVEGINNGVISELQGYDQMRSEVPYGNEGSRIDILLQQPPARTLTNKSVLNSCYVEVKSVTYGDIDGIGYFPDAVSTRASKHLRELIRVAEQGYRAVVLFCVQHTGIACVKPADHVDQSYGALLRQAVERGVDVLAYQVTMSPVEIKVTRQVKVCL